MNDPEAISWVNIPKPLIDSISYLLRNDKKHRKRIKELQEAIKNSQLTYDKEKLAMHQKIERAIGDRSKIEEISVRSADNSAIEDMKKETALILKKQSEKTKGIIEEANQMIRSFSNKLAIELSESKKTVMQYCDGRIQSQDRRIIEVEQ